MARENLHNHVQAQVKQFQMELDGIIEQYSLDSLMYMTSSEAEYKKVAHILKKGAFKIAYPPERFDQKKPENYDSDDPAEYKDLTIYNESVESLPIVRKTKITPIKKKVSPVELEQKYNITTALCFIKISSFQKQAIGNSLYAILNMMQVELLGLKIVRCSKELYFENVPREVK
jgi:hypothetical protein